MIEDLQVKVHIGPVLKSNSDLRSHNIHISHRSVLLFTNFHIIVSYLRHLLLVATKL